MEMSQFDKNPMTEPCDIVKEDEMLSAIEAAALAMYEALKAVVKQQSIPQSERTNAKEVWDSVTKALAKAEER